MFHKFDICGWHDGVSEAGGARATDIAPSMPIPEQRVDGQTYPNFTGYEWVELVYPGTALPEPEENGG